MYLASFLCLLLLGAMVSAAPAENPPPAHFEDSDNSPHLRVRRWGGWGGYGGWGGGWRGGWGGGWRGGWGGGMGGYGYGGWGR